LPVFLAAGLWLLGLLPDMGGSPGYLRGPVLKVRRLIDRFRGEPGELLGIFIVAVVARFERDGQQPCSAIAHAGSVVFPLGHESNNDKFAGFVA
jgi:hypothetical protein